MQSYFHPCGARGLPLVLGWLAVRPFAHAWILILLSADLAALGDVITGPDIWFGPVYLLVICLAAWSLGWRAGLMTGFGCMTLTFMINGIMLYPYASTEWVWNLLTRFTALSIVVAVVAGARSVYIREWWLARTDPLTGAFNRQAFFELSDELASDGSWRLLIYADLDGLKRINDEQGHAAGDRSIRDFAAAVRQAIRWTDMFARVGGDEFLIFMRVRDLSAARVVAKRLHGQMNRVPDGQSNNLQCSVGALIVPPGQMQIDQLVRHADNLMYHAKHRGGGLQIEVAQDLPETVVVGRARKARRIPYVGHDATPALSDDRRNPNGHHPHTGEARSFAARYRDEPAGCCQSDRNRIDAAIPGPAELQAASDCHSASAAERQTDPLPARISI